MTSQSFREQLQAMVLPGLKNIQPYQPGKPIEELERELGIRNAVKLASNENPLGISASAVQAINKALAEVTRYPDGNAYYLKQKLADKLGVGANQITIGNGSNEILELLGRMFLSPGVSAVVSQHAFVVYDLTITAQSALMIKVPAREWGHDIAAMQDAVGSDTRMLFIANPNNPTGTWVSSQAIEQLLNNVSREVIVVVDEAYFEYADQADYQTVLPLLQSYPNLVVTRTFSKAYGLAALRIGYAISHPALAELLNRIRQPFNVNSLALAAATAVLDDEDYLVKSCAVNRAGYQQLTAGFTCLGLKFIPSAGNFIAVEVGPKAAEIYQQLLQLGVIVRPVASYEMPHHLRISIGTEAENSRCLEALKQVLAGKVAS